MGSLFALCRLPMLSVVADIPTILVGLFVECKRIVFVVGRVIDGISDTICRLALKFRMIEGNIDGVELLLQEVGYCKHILFCVVMVFRHFIHSEKVRLKMPLQIQFLCPILLCSSRLIVHLPHLLSRDNHAGKRLRNMNRANLERKYERTVQHPSCVCSAIRLSDCLHSVHIAIGSTWSNAMRYFL